MGVGGGIRWSCDWAVHYTCILMGKDVEVTSGHKVKLWKTASVYMARKYRLDRVLIAIYNSTRVIFLPFIEDFLRHSTKSLEQESRNKPLK